MSSKRQLGRHDEAVNAKRRHLEPFTALASTELYGGILVPAAPGSQQSGNESECGEVVVRNHQVQYYGATMDDTESFEDSSTTSYRREDYEWDIDRMDSTFSSGEPTTSQRICFGALCEVQAKLMCSLDAGIEPRSNVVRCPGARILRFYLCDVVLRDGIRGIVIPGSNAFAMVDLITSKKLEALQDYSTVCTKAVIEAQTLRQLSTKKKAKQPFGISINVYGPESDARNIGKQLGKVEAFLQHPFYVENGIEYWNPQSFDDGDGPKYLTHLVGMSESEIQAKRLSDTVEDVLTSLDHGIPTEPISALELSDLMTSLKGHQEAALLFIRQRENPEYCQKVNRELRFHMRISLEDAVSSMAMGGILADVMGLGKTLTMLASIASSRLAASDFQNKDTDIEAGESSHHRTSATLVVVTSTQIMEVWRNEVSRHFRDGSLQVLTFHGESRPTLPSAMMGRDIVLTTFATLVADYKRGKVLQNLEWFRVVLDEAHWIRNQGSKQFKAAERLISERRWCISGTPIQNSINDLVSLLRFLRFEPFSHMAVFQRHILQPLSKDTLERAKPLQMLLRGMCLRRTGKYLNLPEAYCKHIRLSLDHDEQALYTEVLRRFRREIDDVVSTQAKTRKCTLLFTMMMELRRICNHGTLRVPIPGLQSPKTLTNTGIDSLCDYCDEAEEGSMARLNGDSVCPECHRSLSERDASIKSTWDSSPLILHSGLSTKLESVADNICRRSKRYSPFQACAPSSIIISDEGSIVFSYWTATLDLLQRLMEQKNIVLRRIDGRIGNKDRLAALEEFKNDPVISVLLITIQTGAVGLNLTVATQVHIVEPQWNPSVEEQAIARALRMGQTKTVTVFRYMMENTVEENILALQKKKGNLAKFTMDGNSGDGVSGTLEDLKFILDIDTV
ncbi:hypothetical protein FDECE_14622 [Fusarium decemcellulare]|nr:hypothetical protein FDECE_14622 [Fusarium decemcellulare]